MKVFQKANIFVRYLYDTFEYPSKDYGWHVGGLHGGYNIHGDKGGDEDSQQAHVYDYKAQSCVATEKITILKVKTHFAYHFC